jgi:hypothetical protein
VWTTLDVVDYGFERVYRPLGHLASKARMVSSKRVRVPFIFKKLYIIKLEFYLKRSSVVTNFKTYFLEKRKKFRIKLLFLLRC